MPDDRAALEAAYRAAVYVVDAPDGPLSLHVGQTHPELDRLLTHGGVTSWAFVTASNPGSVRLDDADNAARRRALEEAVRRRGKRFLSGRGVAADGSWPAEESLFVLGVDDAEAAELGRRFGQAAVVCGAVGAAARLVWL